MKYRYLIICLCLISLTTNLYAQKSESWKDYNGYKWEEYGEHRYISRFLKYSYVVSAVLNGRYIRDYIANYMKSLLGDKKQSWGEVSRFLSHFLSDDNYGGVSIRQYVAELDAFYNDQRNMLIPIPVAMTIIKNKSEGKKQDEVNSYIMRLRQEYSKSEKEKQ